jgi:hypothetical protein
MPTLIAYVDAHARAVKSASDVASRICRKGARFKTFIVGLILLLCLTRQKVTKAICG